MKDPNDLLTGDEAALEIKCSPNTLPKWRHLGIGPRYLKQAGFVRYRRGDILDWITSRTVTPEVRS